LARLVAEGAFEVVAGAERVRLDGVAADLDAPAGAEVLVTFAAPFEAALHVHAREIADGALACSLGARRAAVTMDVRLLAAILTAALERGLELPRAQARALAAALAD
jgi:hypothetical protein